MISSIRIFFYTLLIIVLQVWVFNPISILTIGTPYIYVLLLLLFPIQTSTNKLLLYSFLVGATIDILSLTPGLHTSVLLPMAMLRQYIVFNFVEKQDELELAPLFSTLSYKSLILLFQLLFAQHILLFIIDSMGLFDWSFLIKRILISLLLSYFFSTIFMLIFSKSVKLKRI